MAKIRNFVFAAVVAVLVFAAILFLFSATSVIESFQLFQHDSQGGSALFLLEVVLALIAGGLAGLLCLHRLCSGWHADSDETTRTASG